MYLLWLGQMLEPALGHARFAALYFASLLAGSFGALLVEPNALTVGASGAIFGLMGAAAIELRARGDQPAADRRRLLILLNLGALVRHPDISIGGHVGGLIGGALVGSSARSPTAGAAALALPRGAASALAAVAVAARSSVA